MIGLLCKSLVAGELAGEGRVVPQLSLEIQVYGTPEIFGGVWYPFTAALYAFSWCSVSGALTYYSKIMWDEYMRNTLKGWAEALNSKPSSTNILLWPTWTIFWMSFVSLCLCTVSSYCKREMKWEQYHLAFQVLRPTKPHVCKLLSWSHIQQTWSNISIHLELCLSQPDHNTKGLWEIIWLETAACFTELRKTLGVGW